MSTPSLIWFNVSLVQWEEAKVHVWSELAIRGTSVFEGIRAYWSSEEKKYYILDFDAHIQRLFQSAKLLRFPVRIDPDTIRDAIFSLLRALDFREHAYIRPTLYIEQGRYGFKPEDTTIGMHIAAFISPRTPSFYSGVRCHVSSWRRARELGVSPRVKAGAAYLAFRLAFIEAMEHGYDDVILLNDHETVAETPGASIFIVKRGIVSTPSGASGILESITRKRLLDLLKDEFGIETREREIMRTELYSADEVFLCGTLCEVQAVTAIDSYMLGNGEPGSLTKRCRDRYLAICESGKHAPAGWLTPVTSPED